MQFKALAKTVPALAWLLAVPAACPWYSGPWYLNHRLFFCEDRTLTNSVVCPLFHFDVACPSTTCHHGLKCLKLFPHGFFQSGFAVSPEGPGCPSKPAGVTTAPLDSPACSPFLKSLQRDSVFSPPCSVPPGYLLDFTLLPPCLTFCFALPTLLSSWFCSVAPRPAATNSPFGEFLCSAPQGALPLPSFTPLLPLVSGVTIQFGDSSSGMVAWEAVRRLSGGWAHLVHSEPLLWNCQRGPWHVPTSVLGTVWRREPKPSFILLV